MLYLVMLYRVFSWLIFVVFLYLGAFYSYTNLSSESFIFLIECFYMVILLVVLYNLYFVNSKTTLYSEYLKLHYERVFIYSIFLKRLNVKKYISIQMFSLVILCSYIFSL